MIRTVAFGCAVLAVGTLTAGAGEAGQSNFLGRGVKGLDDRQIVDAKVYPWSAIGRFNRSWGGHCTATVVGPSLAVTAAHCLVTRSGRMTPLKELHFVAGWQRGEYLFHAKAKRIYLAPSVGVPRQLKLSDVALDWAIVELTADPSPVTGVIAPGPLNRKTFWKILDSEKLFAQAGYSGDRPHVLTAHKGCRLWKYHPTVDLVEHGCHTVPGDSGSPIIYWDGNGYRMAAVHSGRTGAKLLGRKFAVSVAAFRKALKKIAGLSR